jgi:hypothetical protein
MKKLFLLLTVVSMLIYPGMALAQTKGKTQTEKPPVQSQPKAQDHEKQHPQAQSQAQPEKGTQMMCPGMMMMKGQMPEEMQKQMQAHMDQMIKGHMEEMQKKLEDLRQRVEALEKKK